MKARIKAHWENVKDSLWFLPSMMAIGAIALSFLMVHIDQKVETSWVMAVGWLWAGGTDGARAVLSTIAGSTITVAGTTFSITITALVLASSQFGPRLLRNFMADRGNQFVLGTFIATYLYCLLVLRTVRSVDENRFVPYLSVSVGMLLGLLSLGVLIYFIHHMADSIQADNLAAAVAKELRESITRMFPAEADAADAHEYSQTERVPDGFERDAQHIESERAGYVQNLDTQALLLLAQKHDLVIRIQRRPGDFVARGNDLVRAWPPQNCNDKFRDQVCGAYIIGRSRTAMQDVEFSIDQLVEIAVRALSPGINDPQTAMTCVDWLGAALGHIAEREFPSSQYRDDNGKLRVLVANPICFALFADAAYNEIRRYGAGAVAVMIRVLESIAEVAAHTKDDEELGVLRRHADGVVEAARAKIGDPNDRALLDAQHAKTLHALIRN